MLGIQGMRSTEQHEAEQALKQDRVATASGDKPFSVDCSDVESDQAKVQALFKALAEARKRSGDESAGGTFDSFKKLVRTKSTQLRKQYGCQAVEYSVEVQGGQVKLKAKPKT